MEGRQDAVSQSLNFSAFISYSHADTKLVRKLHAQIEAYRLPKDLNRIGTLNRIDRRVGRVFRDRSDLPAGESLSKAVTEALDQSGVLIVACSPDARESYWVEREIAYFRRNRPGRPVLAAILKGEPRDAFPPALSDDTNEPLAADLRKQGDGWRLGFLKIIAGIVDLPLDVLVQRDNQRRLNRVMAITGMVVLIAVVLAAMTVIALQARNEAQFQQAEAENLVEFMLTDLRNDLESVGRIEFMERVNERALSYYRAQGSLADLSDESLLRRARVIEMIGVDNEKRQRFSQARDNFKELSSVTEELLIREPDNPERKLDHASSEARVITAMSTELSKDELRQRSDKVLDTLHSIRAWGQNQPEWLELEALANSNRCVIDIYSNNTSEEANEKCDRSVSASERFVELVPNDEARYILVFNFFWYSKWLELKGDQDLSQTYFARSIQFSNELLVSAPKNVKFQQQRMEILGATSASHPDFHKNICQAASIALKLTALDPDNVEIQKRLKKYNRQKGEYYDTCT